MSTMPDPMANGWWKKIQDGSAEEQADEDGFTNPNLHRRLVSESSTPAGSGVMVGVFGVDSYRYIYTTEHDEESDDSEIP